MRLFLLWVFTAVTAAAGPVAVWVTVPPQKYFVERIGGDRVTVEVLVAPGRNPETYAPTPRQLARLADADLYFGIGVPVEEALLGKVAATLPDLEIVATAEAGEHHHGDGHDHEEGEHVCDPHSWMSPREVIRQAAIIRDALAARAPAEATFFAERAAAFSDDLEAADERFAAVFAPYRGRAFFINHPSLGAFAEAYGIEQRAVEFEGRNAGPKRVRELVAAAREAEVTRLYAQPQFGRSGIDVLARSLELPVVTVDPLAEDYLANLDTVAEALLGGFRKPADEN